MWKPAPQPSTEKFPQPANATAPATTPYTATPGAAAKSNPILSTPQEQAMIGKSLVVKGEVTGSENLFVDGRVEGSITLPGNRVTVGRNGIVAANITALEIVVIGKVRGNLNASDRVEIRSEGSLTGDVEAQRISIEDGAFFKGGIDIRTPSQKTNGEAGNKKLESAAATDAAKTLVSAANA